MNTEGQGSPREASEIHGHVIGLLGPTGVGKTAVAVELARRLRTRVISCDSMQVYKGFPVLTNHPSEAEGRNLHELVGVVDPGETLSAAAYADMARPLVDSAVERSGWAVLAGGSGLYMRAALAPLAAAGVADAELRKRLEERAESVGSGELYADLQRLDAEAAKSIDARNVRRVVRALESVLGSGKPWSGRGDLWDPQYYHPTLVVGLITDRGSLAEAIEGRTRRMVEKGVADEVRRYRSERGEEGTRPGGPGVCSAIGYPEVCAYLQGEISESAMIERIAAATRKYARRQLTWLRKVKDAVMIDVHGREAAAVAKEILAYTTREASGGESSKA